MERGAVVTSEIWFLHYDQAFSLWDSNGNGYIEADFKELLNQFLAMFEVANPQNGAPMLRAVG